MACYKIRTRAHMPTYLWLLAFIQICCSTELSLSNLDAKTFEQRVQTAGIFVVNFCMPWFEPCKALNLELAMAAESLAKTSEVDMYEFDCVKDHSFCESMEVASFPTIRIFDRREWTRYRGAQKASSVVSHVLKRVLDPVVQLEEHQFSTMKTLDLPLLVLTCAKDDDSSLSIMKSLAQKELSNRFFVGVITNSPFTDTVATELPSISVFNIFDDTVPTYEGPFERTAILEFADKVSKPLIRQLDLPNLGDLMKSGIPLAMLFSANEDERKLIAKRLTDIAMQYHNRINFATVDAEKYSFLLGHFGLESDHLPSLIIQTADDAFKFDPGSEITPDAVDRFIKQNIYN